VRFDEMLTSYEFLFLNSEISVLIDMVLIPIVKDKFINKDLILKALCVASIFVMAYSVLTYGQAYLHSDMATATLLSESIIKHRNFFPMTWNYVNGEIWVLNNHLFCILPTLLMKNKSLSRLVGSLCFIMVALTGVVYQSKKMFRNNTWVITIPLLLVYIFGDSDLNQSAYTGHILWLSLCSTLIFEIYKNNKNHEKRNRKYLCIYSILMILFLMGGLRMLAEQAVPAWCACVFFIYYEICEESFIDWKMTFKRLGYMTCVIFIPAGIGYGIYNWICVRHNVYTISESQITFTFVDSLEKVWDNLKCTVLNIFSIFGYSGNIRLLSVIGLRNFISIIICAIVCFIVPYLQGRKFKEESGAVQFLYVFGMIHNLEMIVLSVFFDMTASRYMLTSIFVSCLISARYIYEYWIHQENLGQFVWTSLFVVATVVECMGFLMFSRGWTDVVAEKKSFNQELVSHGLTKGYATYWNAYENEVYSDLQISYGGVIIYENSITPWHALVDSEVFEVENKNTFLLLNEEENNIINNNLVNICGYPIDSFIINGRYVYVFDHDIASDFK